MHPEPIAENLAASAERVAAEGLDLAVAQDGDADRLGVLDRRGQFVSPHRVFALLLLHAYRAPRASGGIAKTFSTSLLIDRVAAALGVPLHETPIGFKYVADLMNRGEADVGGEESGGYAFAFHLPERDGVLNALLLVESLALSGSDLDGALAGPLPRVRRVRLRAPRRLPARCRSSGRSSGGARRAPTESRARTVTDVRDMDGVKYVLRRRADGCCIGSPGRSR